MIFLLHFMFTVTVRERVNISRSTLDTLNNIFREAGYRFCVVNKKLFLTFDFESDIPEFISFCQSIFPHQVQVPVGYPSDSAVEAYPQFSFPEDLYTLINDVSDGLLIYDMSLGWVSTHREKKYSTWMKERMKTFSSYDSIIL
jgi:hypothetical protein